MLGKVNRIAIGIKNPEFRLSIGRSFFNVCRGAPLLTNWNHGIDAFHLETEMIDALLQMIALNFPFRTYGDNCQVQMTVRQIGGRPHSLNDFETERIRIKFHQPSAVLGENSKMANASHETPPDLGFSDSSIV